MQLLDAAFLGAEVAKLRSLWLGVRHLRELGASYWWLDGAFEKERPRDFGLPVRPIQSRTPFAGDHEIAEAWNWVLAKTVELSLDEAVLDEQLWWQGGDRSSADLEAALAWAGTRFPARLIEFFASGYPAERGVSGGYSLSAQFEPRAGSGRAASATLVWGTEGDALQREIWSWAQRTAARLGVPLRGTFE